MHCTKTSPEFECQRSKVNVTGVKNEKVRHFVRESSSGSGLYAAFFSGVVLGVVGHCTGGKISTCCLVSVLIHPDCPRMAIKLVVVFFR